MPTFTPTAPPLEAAARARGVRRVLLVTLGLNLGVAAAKIVVGTLAHALSIRADGIHSSTDGINNVILLVATAIAARPADREHPYGHRRFELFAALGVGLLLLTLAFSIGRDVVTRLQEGAVVAPPTIDALALGTLVITLGVNLFVAWWERRSARRLHSPALLADAAHTQSDIAVTVGVLVGALFVRQGYAVVDTFASVVVAGVIAWTGVSILKDNLRFLADTALADVDAVIAAARSVGGVRDAFAVRSRGTPGALFIDLNIAVDGALSVAAAHALAHHVEDAVRAQIAGVVDVHVHIEPSPEPPLSPSLSS